MTLESFQEEIGRRILKLSRFHSGLAVRVLLQGPSVKTRVLMRKLIFLKQVVSGDDVVSSQVFRTLVRWQGMSTATCPGVQVPGGKLGNKLHIRDSATSQ